MNIGISLGKINSYVSIIDKNGNQNVIVNECGNRFTPCCVSFNENGDFRVGEDAYSDLDKHSNNVVFDSKLLIGRKFSDPVVQENLKYLPFKVVEKEDKPFYEIINKEGKEIYYSPEQISSYILNKMKSMVEQYTGKKVERAVITVPASFNQDQRNATIQAANLAHIKATLLDEPIAAVIAYDLDKKSNTSKNVLVYHFGGGSIEISIVGIDENGDIQIKEKYFNPNLGGNNIDYYLMNHLVTDFNQKHNVNLTLDNTNRDAKFKLLQKCEQAKKELSVSPSTVKKIHIDKFYQNVDLVYNMSGDTMDSITTDIQKKVLNKVEKILKKSNLSKDSIDNVILIGGSFKYPKFQSSIENYFGPNKIKNSIMSSEVASMGAVKSTLRSNKIKE